MRVEEVTGEDPRVSAYRRLTDVEWRSQVEPRWGLFLAEGYKVIERAVQAGYQPHSALMSSKWLPALTPVLESFDIPVLVAPEEVLRQVVGFRLHRGALAAFGRREQPAASELFSTGQRMIGLEGLVDHTNVGLIFRTAAALGMDAALLSPQCADPYYRRAVKTSMGAVLTLPWARTELPWPQALRDAQNQGVAVVGLTPDPRAEPLPEWVLHAPDRVLLLLGTEGNGLTGQTAAACDALVSIPLTPGIDSLNVAAAAAIACYLVGRATGRSAPQ